jgi:hypothetical protein
MGSNNEVAGEVGCNQATVVKWRKRFAWNDNPKPFVWHKTADQILDSLKKYLTNL